MAVHSIDWIVFGIYLLVVFAFGLYMSLRDESSKDFFLAGRSLPWYAIALSLFASNISSGSLVALAGDAYRYGIAVSTLEWGAIICLILLAFVFLPYYRRMAVITTPEFLEKRYGPSARTLFAGTVVIVELSVYLPFLFYAGGLFLETLFALPFFWSVLGIALFVGLYTTIGGLSAVVWTDVIQGVLMVAGGLTVTVLALVKIGGWLEFYEHLPEGHMSVFLPADHPAFPFPATLIGGYFMISIYYWCQNQTIVQRTLAGRSDWDSRMGAVGAGYIKLILPFVLVLPGVLAVVLIPDLGSGAGADKALPLLIKAVVPTGFMGLVMAAMVASLMSSADSGLNSLATIVTNDFYHRWIDRQASATRLVLIGRVASVAILVCAVARALTLQETPSLMQFLQSGLAYLAAPVIVVFIAGLFWRGATSAGAVTTFIAAPLVCLFAQNGHTVLNEWLPGMFTWWSADWFNWWPAHVVYWLPIAVGLLTALLVGISLFTKRKTDAELEPILWTPQQTLTFDQRAFDRSGSPVVADGDKDKGSRRPWVYDYRLWAALALILMVVEIWWFR